MVAIRIDVDAADLQAGLARLIAAGQDLTPVMDEIGDIVVAATLGRFERGQAPDGSAWKPSQRALTEGGKTLVKDEFLRNSIVSRSGPNQVEVGTNIIYARIHQFGGQAGRGGSVTLPARPFLGTGAAERSSILDALAAYIRNRLED